MSFLPYISLGPYFHPHALVVFPSCQPYDLFSPILSFLHLTEVRSHQNFHLYFVKWHGIVSDSWVYVLSTSMDLDDIFIPNRLVEIIHSIHLRNISGSYKCIRILEYLISLLGIYSSFSNLFFLISLEYLSVRDISNEATFGDHNIEFLLSITEQNQFDILLHLLSINDEIEETMKPRSLYGPLLFAHLHHLL